MFLASRRAPLVTRSLQGSLRSPQDKDGEVYYLWPERDLEAEAQHSGKEKIKVFKPIPKETLIRAVEEKKGVIVTLDEGEKTA